METNENEVGVTGREVLKRIAGSDAAEAIYAMGYVCVPRKATAMMVKSAHYDAMDEDANGVWDSMIGVADGTIKGEETLDQ